VTGIGIEIPFLRDELLIFFVDLILCVRGGLFVQAAARREGLGG
jgi:hypothetical protein